MPAGSPQTINLGNGFYQSDSLHIASMQCANCYPNYPETEAISRATLFGTPGLIELVDTGALVAANRGSITLNNIPYFVQGNTLYRLDETSPNVFAAVSLGTISGSGRVSLAQNGTQICILVPGGTGYIYTDSGGLVEITAPDFRANGNPLYVVYINGFFVFNTDEQWLISSAVNDGLSYNALDRVRAQVDPDDIVAPFVFKNQLFVFGTKVTEVFEGDPSVTTGFPFSRIEGFIIDKGLTAPFAVVNFDNAFVFLGQGENERPAIWRVDSNIATKISHTAIDVLIQTLTDQELSDSFAMTYSQDGAYFAVFTADVGTIVFDATATRNAGRPIWHTRNSIVSGIQSRWRVNSIVTAYGKLIAGDNNTGKIGEIERTEFTEYGETIQRIWSSPPIDADSDPVFLDFIEITMETGVGPYGSLPKIGMEISRDGGKTYGDLTFRNLGRTGNYRKRVIWNRMGRSPLIATYRFIFSEPIKFVLSRMRVGFS